MEEMIDFIKSLPKPVLIGSCIVIYILIGMVVSFIVGLFDDGNEDLIVVGVFWVFVLPLAAIFGVLWLFVALFRLGAKVSKSPKPIDNDWIEVNELKDYYEEDDTNE